MENLAGKEDEARSGGTVGVSECQGVKRQLSEMDGYLMPKCTFYKSHSYAFSPDAWPSQY
jgi:hypothetical protein